MTAENRSGHARLEAIRQRTSREHQLRERLGTRKSPQQNILDAILGTPTRALKSEFRADEQAVRDLSNRSKTISHWVLAHGDPYLYPRQDIIPEAEPEEGEEVWVTRFTSRNFDVFVHGRLVDGQLQDEGPLQLDFRPEVDKTEFIFRHHWEGDIELLILFREGYPAGRNPVYNSGVIPLTDMTDEEAGLMLDYAGRFMSEQGIPILAT